MSQSYEFRHVNFEREMEHLCAQQMLSWEQEAQKLRAFGLQDGMRVLELGSGPGFMTEQLLLLLPHSTVTAIEIAPEMVEYAQYYLTGKYEERWEVVLSSINVLPFPDALSLIPICWRY